MRISALYYIATAGSEFAEGYNSANYSISIQTIREINDR